MSNKVYIGHLSSRTRERDIEDAFGKFGKIMRCDLKYGYAFIVCNFSINFVFETNFTKKILCNARIH